MTQVLEGPAAAVRELFTAIMVDSRHTDCRLSKEELLLSEEVALTLTLALTLALTRTLTLTLTLTRTTSSVRRGA